MNLVKINTMRVYNLTCDECGKTEQVSIDEQNYFVFEDGLGLPDQGWRGWRYGYSPKYSGVQFLFCSDEHKQEWLKQNEGAW